jgi:hypothetical protein
MRFILASIVSVVVGTLTTPAAADLVRCRAAGASTPLNSGSLSDSSPVVEADLAAAIEFSFDSASGLLRVHRRNAAQSQPFQFEVLQKGSASNDLVAISRRPCAASCPFDFLRVRVWQKPVTFLFVDSTGGIYTGRCES